MKYLTLLAPLLFSGCMYTDSALNYAKEGTLRVNKGYEAKARMTKELTAYLKEVNKGCGVTVTMVNGSPVTNVKECIRINDAMASVDRIQIVKPQQIGDMLDSAGDFILKATNLAVPVASIYYGSKNHLATTEANVRMQESNNNAQANMVESYTSNFDKTTINDSVSTSTDKDHSVTTTTTTDKDHSTTTTNTSQSVPTIDTNGTVVNVN